MLHSQQLHPQQQQQGGSLLHDQQSQQNPSALSGSSHKHSQQSTIEFLATNRQQDLVPQQGCPKDCSKGMDDNLPPADAAIRAAGGHGDKQPIYKEAQQKQNMKVSNQNMKTKESVFGVASLNIAELTSVEQETEFYLPLLLPEAAESNLSLHLALSILELRSPQDFSEIVLNSLTDTSTTLSVDVAPSEKDELFAGLRKVKILTEFVSTQKSKKTCPDDDGGEGKCSTRSDDAEYTYPFITDFSSQQASQGYSVNNQSGVLPLAPWKA